MKMNNQTSSTHMPYPYPRSWSNYLAALGGQAPEQLAEGFSNYQASGVAPALQTGLSTHQTIQESMRLMLLVRAYQTQGHFAANLDPLKMDNRAPPIVLDPALYGFTDKDLDREFFLGTWRMSGFLSEERPVRKLSQILDRLKQCYCGSIGFEYMHIMDRDKCNWLRERIESAEQKTFSKARKLRMLDRLAWSEMFENFLSTKYSAAKRFGLEGGETLIPGMKALIDRAAELGCEMVVIGMPHRGRLNVLGNVVRKPLAHIFSEFQGGVKPSKDGGYTGSGDVKYHLGTSYDRPTVSGKRVHLSLVANPSHLEAVNTVVIGKTRAKQFYTGDEERTRNMAILLHGDGSMAGQGIVMETLDMAKLPEYTVGGTIHLVVNNQVAFTTDTKFSRSGEYCTSIAKGLGAPVFHVNGDDVEAVSHVMELAAEWRQTWKEDVVVDLVCYRKHGHNEIDEPSFTQPLMYDVIRKHRSAQVQYAEALLAAGTVTADSNLLLKFS
jgi:2-oxoglutarate dehydrogenase E1 component